MYEWSKYRLYLCNILKATQCQGKCTVFTLLRTWSFPQTIPQITFLFTPALGLSFISICGPSYLRIIASAILGYQFGGSPIQECYKFLNYNDSPTPTINWLQIYEQLCFRFVLRMICTCKLMFTKITLKSAYIAKICKSTKLICGS